jgi:hypothetical protein
VPTFAVLQLVMAKPSKKLVFPASKSSASSSSAVQPALGSPSASSSSAVQPARTVGASASSDAEGVADGFTQIRLLGNFGSKVLSEWTADMSQGALSSDALFRDACARAADILSYPRAWIKIRWSPGADGWTGTVIISIPEPGRLEESDAGHCNMCGDPVAVGAFRECCTCGYESLCKNCVAFVPARYRSLAARVVYPVATLVPYQCLDCYSEDPFNDPFTHKQQQRYSALAAYWSQQKRICQAANSSWASSLNTLSLHSSELPSQA